MKRRLVVTIDADVTTCGDCPHVMANGYGDTECWLFRNGNGNGNDFTPLHGYSDDPFRCQPCLDAEVRDE